MDNVPWMTEDTLAWFAKQGFCVDCESKRVYLGEDKGSWVVPKEEYWTDRLTLRSAICEILIEFRQNVKKDKAAVRAAIASLN